MQYDLKDIAERVARIKELEQQIYWDICGLERGYNRVSLNTIRARLTTMRLDMNVVADLLPKVNTGCNTLIKEKTDEV